MIFPPAPYGIMDGPELTSIQLSNKRRATVREFKGSTLIDLREVSTYRCMLLLLRKTELDDDSTTQTKAARRNQAQRDYL